MSKEIIIRKRYLERVKSFINQNIIKVFTGQRRVGKSYVLKMIASHIQQTNPAAKIIFIDKERYDFDFMTDYHALITYVQERLEAGKTHYLFIDEIQEIRQFEKALRHFQNSGAVDIYCSGSNAETLSSDLATLIGGRYVEIQVHTLSYGEFLEFNRLENTAESLEKYLKWGGLPFIKNLHKDDHVIFDYLENIVSTIVYKDVLLRHQVRNVAFFENLLDFIAANTGNMITAKRISDYLKSQRIDMSVRVILNYLHYLQNAYLIYKLNRFDIRSKKVFEIGHKYFFEDWGIRNALLGLSRFSVPAVLENVVFSHLKQCGYKVSIGLWKNLEIDFVAEKGGDRLYVQVAYLIPDQKVKEREFGNLMRIHDHYPKRVVSLDPHPIGDYQGIKHCHLQDFLMRETFS